MAKNPDGIIERYEDLYAYLKQHPDKYKIVKSQHNVLEVHLLDPSGNPIEDSIEYPETYRRLRTHYFHDIEVTRPRVTIPEKVIIELIDKLEVPRSLFVYPP